MLPGIFPLQFVFLLIHFLCFIEFAVLSTPLWLNFDSNNRISSTTVSNPKEEWIYHTGVYHFHRWINSNKSLSFKCKMLVHYALPGECLRNFASFWCSKGSNGKYYAAYKYTHTTSYLKIEINVTQLVLLKVPAH